MIADSSGLMRVATSMEGLMVICRIRGGSESCGGDCLDAAIPRRAGVLASWHVDPIRLYLAVRLIAGDVEVVTPVKRAKVFWLT
jgi:hypothetical protein